MGKSGATQGRLGRDYYKVWAASSTSNFGDGILSAALPLLAATLTRDPLAFAATAGFGQLPWILLSLHAGAFVDRVDRRVAMMAVNGFRALVLAFAGIAVLQGWASMPLLYGLAFLLGAAETVFDNASPALLPAVVPKESLEHANGRLISVQLLANQFLGPPVGAAMFGLAVAVPFFADAAAYGIAVLALSFLSGSFRPRGDGSAAVSTMAARIKEGVAWLWRDTSLRALAVVLGLMNLLWAAAFATLALYALEVLELPGMGFGLMLTVAAVGSALGGPLTPKLTARLGRRAVLRGGLVTLGVAYLTMGLTSTTAVACAALAVAGFVTMVWNVITMSVRQALIPDQLLGRVFAAFRWLGRGALPVGAFAGGAIAEWGGLRLPWLVAGVALLGLALASMVLVHGAYARIFSRDFLEP